VTRRTLLIAAYLAIAIAILAARPPETPGPIARDFEAFWSAGAAYNAHVDPYSASIWRFERTVPGVDARREGALPFIDPPPTLPAWSLAARTPYATAAAIWMLVLVGALVGFVIVSLRGAATSLRATNLLAALALAVAFGPITSDMALGQLALPAAFGAVALVVWARRSVLIATLGGVLAFAQPNIVPGLISQLGRNRATAAITAAAALTYLLGAAVAGWNWPAAYARAGAAHGAVERFSAIQLTPAAIAYGFGAPPNAAVFVAIVSAVAAVAAALLIGLRIRDGFARFAAWSVLAPFATLFWHEHDLLVAFPAAVWCARNAGARARTLALAGTMLVAIDWLGLAQRPGGLAQSALLAAAAWCAFAALCEGVGSSLRVAGIAVGALFAGAAVLALAHPAPVWPAAMQAFSAPVHATVAQIWLAQQRATGLYQPVASWAVLRALSLLGCALLAVAIYRHSSYCRTA